MIGGAGDRFDAGGKLTHEPTREFIKTMLLALQELAIMLKHHKK